MTTLREAAELAMEAMEFNHWAVAGQAPRDDVVSYVDAIHALRTALEADNSASKPEPVAWMRGDGGHVDFHKHPAYLPLYTAPPQRESIASLILQSKQRWELNFGPASAADWIYSDLLELLDMTTPESQCQPLTDEELFKLGAESHEDIAFARAIERAHGIGGEE